VPPPCVSFGSILINFVGIGNNARITGYRTIVAGIHNEDIPNGISQREIHTKGEAAASSAITVCTLGQKGKSRKDQIREKRVSTEWSNVNMQVRTFIPM
jgi:hypothetical protein